MPVDYRFLEVNAAFEVQTGFVDAVERLVRDLVLLEFSRAVHVDELQSTGTADVSASLAEAISVLKGPNEESRAVIMCLPKPASLRHKKRAMDDHR